MRSALRVLLLALLVALAGCAGAFGGPATETPDDRPTTTADAATADGQFAPGLTGDGLTDADALVNAHADALTGQSVTLREEQIRRYENGSLRWSVNRTLRTAANRTRFLRVVETSNRSVFGASEGRVAVFADGEAVYRSVETANTSWISPLRTASGGLEAPRNVRLDLARTDDLYVVLDAFALNDSANVDSADAPGRYRVVSDEIARPDLLASHLNLTAVRNATLTAVVTDDGLLTEYRLEFVGEKRGATIRGTAAVRYSSVGETSVEAPEWYEEAEQKAD